MDLSNWMVSVAKGIFFLNRPHHVTHQLTRLLAPLHVPTLWHRRLYTTMHNSQLHSRRQAISLPALPQVCKHKDCQRNKGKKKAGIFAQTLLPRSLPHSFPHSFPLLFFSPPPLLLSITHPTICPCPIIPCSQFRDFEVIDYAESVRHMLSLTSALGLAVLVWAAAVLVPQGIHLPDWL